MLTDYIQCAAKRKEPMYSCATKRKADISAETLRSEFFSSPPSAPWSPLTTPAAFCALDDEMGCFLDHEPAPLIVPAIVAQKQPDPFRLPASVVEVANAPPSTPRTVSPDLEGCDHPRARVSCKLCNKAVSGTVFMGFDCAYCCEDHRRLALEQAVQALEAAVGRLR